MSVTPCARHSPGRLFAFVCAHSRLVGWRGEGGLGGEDERKVEGCEEGEGIVGMGDLRAGECQGRGQEWKAERGSEYGGEYEGVWLIERRKDCDFG